ncbi:hypothetical protein [uncultured Dokdonia sp.]|uniref:hypothetical protein n=1 Tax=uncultured Dokdonia sp. TaxID=575653 RepID=UPI002632B97A|nr:hypothetical protein [uncultured Dokdonia sp.]
MRRLDMSSIGFAALGRTLIKNNRAQRPESKRNISLTSETTHYIDPKKASPELLEQIKDKIEKENRKRLKRVVIITSIFFFIVLFSMYYMIINL